MEDDKVFIDVRTSHLTVAETMAEIRRIQQEYPDYEIFLDGDAHAIVGRRKQ